MKATGSHPVAHVLGIDVDAIDMQGALGRVATVLQGSRKGYVCVAGVHGVMEAQRNSQLLEVYSASEMTIPDGMPLVWVGRMQGHAKMQRVTGPDLMLEIFRRSEFAHVTHFIYGGDEGIAEELRDKLKERFPWVKIVGTYTPPFRELSDSEQKQFVSTIKELKPDIIWVGISCPKQEIFMARYLPMLETKLMFGVGAAFDYHTGRIRDCAEWVKSAGLQWLHRLVQDPKRLWWRYLRNNPRFVLLIGLQILRMRREPLRSDIHKPETQRNVEVRS
ncbi:WecB/TagA/CpsF family glycosyltransferase [Acidicapsa ligni]|uniref:WecB/TagA/CpsF family glycosyltransferase n=1 Tax=Acidicapsa ligni TaxID=542300 RepID=UPI0021E0AF8D|nr:WecB/TagA/CpsF family glycosyltransferase [Acidicapsa ligni]